MSAKTNKEMQQEWADAQIASSKQFVACMFTGVGTYEKRWADSIEGARRHADNIIAEYDRIRYGRGVVIYAIPPKYELTIYVEYRNRR